MNDRSKFQIDITQGKLRDGTHIPDEVSDKLCKSFKFSQGQLLQSLKGSNDTLLICDQDNVEEILELLEGLGISAEAQLAEVQEEDESDSLFGPQEVSPIAFDIDDDNAMQSLKNSPTKTDLILGELDFETKDISQTASSKSNVNENIAVSPSSPITEIEGDDDLLFPTMSSVKVDIDPLVDHSSETMTQPEIPAKKTSGFSISFDDDVDDEDMDFTSTDDPVDNAPHVIQSQTNVSSPSAASVASVDTIFDSYDGSADEKKKEEFLSADNWLKHVSDGETVSQNEAGIATPRDANNDSKSHRLSPSQVMRLKRMKQIRKIAMISAGCLVLALAVWLFSPSHTDQVNDTFVTEAQIKKIIDSEKESTTPVKVAKKLPQSFEGTVHFDSIEGKILCKIVDTTIEYVSLEFEKKTVENPTEDEFRTGIFKPRFVALRGTGELNQVNTISSRVTYKQGSNNKKLITPLHVTFVPESQKVRIYSQDLGSNFEANTITFKDAEASGQQGMSVFIEIQLNEVERSEQNRSISDLIDSQLKTAAPKEDKKEKKDKKNKSENKES